MTDHGYLNPNPELFDPLAMVSYRGRIGPGAFFGGVPTELVPVRFGMMAFPGFREREASDQATQA